VGIQFHRIFNGIIRELSSSVEKVEVPRNSHHILFISEILFVFPLNVSNLSLAQSKNELVLQNNFICDILMS